MQSISAELYLWTFILIFLMNLEKHIFIVVSDFWTPL